MMTKKEYLDKLYYEIGNMRAEQKDEIISIFVEHFEQGGLDGKSEEEICGDLGNPANVAAQFLDNNREWLQNSITAEETRAPEQRNVQEHYAEKPSYDDKPSYVDIQIDKRINADGIRNININMHYSDIKILPCAGNEFAVRISGQAKNSRYDVYASDGVLNIIEERKFVLVNLFNISKSTQTRIYVPEGYNGTLYMKNKAGNTQMEDITLHHAELHSTAGDIRINRYTGGLELNSTAGDTKLYDIHGNIDLHSTAGDITAENCGGDIKTFSTAGNIKLQDCRGFITSSTTAGNIKIIADELYDLDASSSAGNVKVETLRIAGDIKLKSSVGNVKLEAREVAGSITARTSMGNVTVILPQDTSIKIISKTVGKNKCRLNSDPLSPYTLDVSASFGDISIKTWD